VSIDGPAADTIELLRQVSARQESLMAFYYTDADHQVHMTEIFDVTSSADPALLRAAAAAAETTDDFGIDYSAEDLLDHRRHHFAADHDLLTHSQSSPGGLLVGGGEPHNRHHSYHIRRQLSMKSSDQPQRGSLPSQGVNNGSTGKTRLADAPGRNSVSGPAAGSQVASADDHVPAKESSSVFSNSSSSESTLSSEQTDESSA
jgi:hypothetical protein